MSKRINLDNRARLPSFHEEEEQPTAPAAEPPGEDVLAESPEDDREKENQAVLEEDQKKEEAKLKSKYPGLKATGGSSFLAQKKLQRGGHKFFDSGDYNVVKGKKAGLSGTTSGASKTKPEKAKEVKADLPFATSEVGHDIPTADAIISRRMALFRTKSESYADDSRVQFPGGRKGSMFVTSSVTNLNQIGGSGGIRRGSMFPMTTSSPGNDVLPPEELLQKRRQSMIPAIPSKLVL